MGAIPSALLSNANAIRLFENARFGQKVSLPQGYQQASRAILPSLITTDFISARIKGDSSFVNTQISIAQRMSAFLDGEGFVNPNAEVGKTMWATITGEGNLAGDARMTVRMSATLDAGSRPSAFDIAQEVWQGQAANYNAAGTMGNKLNSAGSGGVDYQALGEAVWSILQSDADTPDSMGEKLKQLLTLGQFIALKE